MANTKKTTIPTASKGGSSDQLQVTTNIATMMAATADAAIAVGDVPLGPSAEYYAAWQKCRELGKRLSQALAETGDNEFAFIQPAGVDFAVGFGQLQDDTKREIEYPVETVDRLSIRLSFALDDWSEYTNWKSAAHVYPASTGRGFSYENIEAPSGSEAVARLGALLNEAAGIIRDNPSLEIERISINQHGVHTLRKIPSADGVKKQQRLKPNHPARALSFMRPKPQGGGIDYWNVEPTGRYSTDCERGKELADEFIRFLGENPSFGNATLLGPLVLDMIASPPAKGLVIGFMEIVNEHVLSLAHLMKEMGLRAAPEAASLSEATEN